MLSSSELVSWDQENGQWRRPEEGEGGGGRGGGAVGGGRREGTARDSVRECSSTLSE